MVEELTTQAFQESLWLGIAVVLVIANLAYLTYKERASLQHIRRLESDKDALRDRYEAQQREDLKLFLEVQNTLKSYSGTDIQRILSEIHSKIEKLLIITGKE